MVGYGLSRYERHLKLSDFSTQTQQRISDASVVVVGAGGLGSPVLLYLAAAGIGEIVVIDDDVVSVNNLQRQIIHDANSVQEPKVYSVQTRLAALNEDVRVKPIGERLTSATASEICKDAALVVDCSDNFATRFLIDDVCETLGVPVVWGSVSGYYGQVSVFPHSQHQHDGRIGSADFSRNDSAATAKDQLCANPAPRLRTLFPEASPEEQCQKDAAAPEPPEKTGTFGPLCGIVGSIMASEVLKVLGNIGEPLIGRILLIDTLAANIREVKIAAENVARS